MNYNDIPEIELGEIYDRATQRNYVLLLYKGRKLVFSYDFSDKQKALDSYRKMCKHWDQYKQYTLVLTKAIRTNR